MLNVGDRIRLSGGYERRPRWLGEKVACEGVVTAFKHCENNVVAVVHLSESIEVEGQRGDQVILSLRYTGAVWADEGVVHIELCDFDPESKDWEHRRLGIWAEAAASYKRLS